jgi:hypothetical protein
LSTSTRMTCRFRRRRSVLPKTSFERVPPAGGRDLAFVQGRVEQQDLEACVQHGAKRRQVSVPASDLAKLACAVAKGKERFGMPASSSHCVNPNAKELEAGAGRWHRLVASTREAL